MFTHRGSLTKSCRRSTFPPATLTQQRHLRYASPSVSVARCSLSRILSVAIGSIGSFLSELELSTVASLPQSTTGGTAGFAAISSRLLVTSNGRPSRRIRPIPKSLVAKEKHRVIRMKQKFRFHLHTPNTPSFPPCALNAHQPLDVCFSPTYLIVKGINVLSTGGSSFR